MLNETYHATQSPIVAVERSDSKLHFWWRIDWLKKEGMGTTGNLGVREWLLRRRGFLFSTLEIPIHSPEIVISAWENQRYTYTNTHTLSLVYVSVCLLQRQKWELKRTLWVSNGSFRVYNRNEEKTGGPAKVLLLKLHVVEECLGSLEMARNRTVPQTF